MRRILIAVLTTMLTGASVAVAQSPAIGFKLGTTYANVDVDADADPTEEGRLSGFGGGGFIRFGFGPLALQADILAITKGTVATHPTEGQREIELEYVEVPVQAVFSMGSGRLSPYLMVGPTFSFETDCTVEDELPGDAEGQELDCGDADFFQRKSFDIGATAALGLSIPLGPGSVLLEGRYSHGFGNINDEGDEKVRNRWYGFFAGYSIGIGR